MTSPSDPTEIGPVTDGLTFVRQHPEMFRHLVHDGPSAAGLLVETALRKFVRQLEVKCIEGWYVISAWTDWYADLGNRDPFTELVPFPSLGPNAIYPEVMVAAYSEALTTILCGDLRRVHGELPDIERLVSNGLPDGRVVIFRFGPPVDS